MDFVTHAACPACTAAVPVLPAESATCRRCGHRFPITDVPAAVVPGTGSMDRNPIRPA